MNNNLLVEMKNIKKNFSRVQALRGVDFNVEKKRDCGTSWR